jgi:hypothetical protein
MSTAPVQPSLKYYLDLFTSQYQGPNTSPNLLALAALLMQPFLDVSACADSLPAAFNLSTAVGVQLDALGTLIGVSRTLPFTPTSSVSTDTANAITVTGPQPVAVLSIANMYVGQEVMVDTGGSEETVEITQLETAFPHPFMYADFTLTHASGVPVVDIITAVLGDSDYRILLMAKVIQNQFNGLFQGSGSTLWQSWQLLFPGGHIYITDNQNMTADVFIAGSFTPLQIQMIQNGLIVPRPEGVEFTYEFGTLPLFGFDDLNPTFVAGFDTGHWS